LPYENSLSILFTNREHRLEIPKVLRATPASFLKSLKPACKANANANAVALKDEPKSELKQRVRDSILLDDFFIKKVQKDEQPRKTLHRALLEFNLSPHYKAVMRDKIKVPFGIKPEITESKVTKETNESPNLSIQGSGETRSTCEPTNAP
jgi:hypothetical protein